MRIVYAKKKRCSDADKAHHVNVLASCQSGQHNTTEQLAQHKAHKHLDF